MAFSINNVAPREDTRTKVFTLLGHKSEVTFFPNRITLEPGDADQDDYVDGDDDLDDETREANFQARALCRIVKSWDWVGPVVRNSDGAVLVGDGEPVPVDPVIVQCVPTRLIRALNDAISDNVFPKSRNERRLRNR